MAPAAAQPPSVVYGTTITRSTVLRADLGPCPGHSIIVGADNVTVNLNGNRVIGSEGPVDGIGIYLLGRSNVTVTNGTVTGFEIGVAIEGGGDNKVVNMTAQDNYGRSGRSRGGDGFAILSSSGNRIVNSRAIGNGPFSGIGIYSRVDGDHARETAGPSTDNRIVNNEVLDNTRSRSGTPSSTDNDGIRLENGGERNVILNNVVRGNRLGRHRRVRRQLRPRHPGQHRVGRRVHLDGGTAGQRDHRVQPQPAHHRGGKHRHGQRRQRDLDSRADRHRPRPPTTSSATTPLLATSCCRPFPIRSLGLPSTFTTAIPTAMPTSGSATTYGTARQECVMVGGKQV